MISTSRIITVLLLTSLTSLFPTPHSAAGTPPVRFENPASSSSTQLCATLSAWPGSYIIATSTNLADSWLNEATQTVTSTGATEIRLSPLARTQLFVRATGLTPSDGRGCLLQLETLGSNFAPAIHCDAVTPTEFCWFWSDGGTNTQIPVASHDFGTPGARTHGLLIAPSNAISSINLGFDGADGGETTPLDHHPGQSVSRVLFPYPLTSLRYWASSYNPIANTLDFTGFTSLEAIECFQCTTLQHVRVTDLPNLMRACFEDCDLQELDLSGNPNLRDLRGALNSYTNILTGRGTGPLIWHWCTRDNPQLTQSFQDIMTNFYALQELFIWNDNQRGTFSTGSTSLTDVIAYNNHYTAGTVSGQTYLARCEFQNNLLTNFTLTGCPALQYLDLHNNRLTAQALDSILGDLDASSSNLVQADLSQNPFPPTALGLTHYSNLTARGASVTIDWLTSNDGLYEVFGDSNSITFITDSQQPHMEIRTGSGTATNIIWHWGDGTISPGARIVNHNFGTAGRHTNYVQVLPASSVSYFGAQAGTTDQGISAVYGASNFSNLNYLFLFNESLIELSLAGCSQLTQLHLANNPVPIAVCDQWFIDLAQAVTGSVSNADFYYPASKRSNASDAAWSILVGKGFSMHPL